MSTLEDLLDDLDASREETLIALEALPDEAFMMPGIIGRWSVADLLSVLTAWDAEVVTGLLRLKQGKPPDKLLEAVATPGRYNAARYEEAQGRDLDVIFKDFQRARLHLEEWLGDLSERALSDPRHYKTLGGVALSDIVARATYEQEARYLPFLTLFAKRWEPEPEDAPQTISPADIDILAPDAAGPSSGNGTEPDEPDDDEHDD